MSKIECTRTRKKTVIPGNLSGQTTGLCYPYPPLWEGPIMPGVSYATTLGRSTILLKSHMAGFGQWNNAKKVLKSAENNDRTFA